MSVSILLSAQHGPAGAPWMLPAQTDDDDIGLSGAVRCIAAERTIYEQGDSAICFFRVVRGTVRTCHLLSDGRRQIDGFHVPGDIFGFEDSAEHHLSAETVTDCTLVAYRRRGAEALDDGVTRQLFAYLLANLKRSQQHCRLLGRASAAQRVALFLLDMARRGRCETVVELAMSRQDIADYLGMTIETVSRTLSQLERDKLIALRTARRVELRDRVALLASTE